MESAQEIRQVQNEIACLRSPTREDLRSYELGTRWRNLLTGQIWILFRVEKKTKPGKLKYVWLEIGKGKK